VTHIVYQVVVEQASGHRLTVRDSDRTFDFPDKKKAEEIAARCVANKSYEAKKVYIVECRVVAEINGGS
jgi:hypothetical protein